jgi:hypothetical protein
MTAAEKYVAGAYLVVFFMMIAYVLTPRGVRTTGTPVRVLRCDCDHRWSETSPSTAAKTSRLLGTLLIGAYGVLALAFYFAGSR